MTHRGRDAFRVGAVSDTHLPRFGSELPRSLVTGLRESHVDLIVHLGDFTGDDVPTLLEAIAPLEAVAGNNDGPELVGRFGRGRVIEAGGIRIGLTHGDLGRGQTTPDRAALTFGPGEADLVLFGHSHIPMARREASGRWLVNPGSPTDKRRQPRYSWALIRVGPDGTVEPELRFFDDRRP